MFFSLHGVYTPMAVVLDTVNPLYLPFPYIYEFTVFHLNAKLKGR